MDNIISEIVDQMYGVYKDINKAKVNKAAARRARKGLLSLEKLGKQFRKLSVEHDKTY